MATNSNETDSSTSAMDRKFTGLRRYNWEWDSYTWSKVLS